ncbi:uncharacterized protein B0H64DRAFT_171913 [Chaetomium fimeti]|uniref:Uncharacterized protein n=1 Tax=Chaetomium fimeti TaxID=1854472 RepID=A0AAE0HHG9_9PEZI|nr:hypothetical protein B0H64DRAFT_171913 [Chaetomium fimeti]
MAWKTCSQAGQSCERPKAQLRKLSKSAVDPRSLRRKHRERYGVCPGGPSSPGRRTANPCLRRAKTVVIVLHVGQLDESVGLGRTLGPPHQPFRVGQPKPPIPIPRRPVRNPAAKDGGHSAKPDKHDLPAQPLLQGCLSHAVGQARAQASTLEMRKRRHKSKERCSSKDKVCGTHGMRNHSTWNLRRWDKRSSEDAPSGPGPKQAVSCTLSSRTPQTRNQSRIGVRRGATPCAQRQSKAQASWAFRSRPALGCSLGAELAHLLAPPSGR